MTDLVRLANLISRINLTIADITNNAGDADPEQAIAVLREAAAEIDRLRAIEKAALAVESQYPKDDAPASIRLLRDALREKGVEK